MVLGDFNLAPKQVRAPVERRGYRVVAPWHGTTKDTEQTFDYALVRGVGARVRVCSGDGDGVDSSQPSDHRAVLLDTTPLLCSSPSELLTRWGETKEEARWAGSNCGLAREHYDVGLYAYKRVCVVSLFIALLSALSVIRYR